MGIDWSTAAEEADVCDGFNLMPCIGRDEDGIAWAYFPDLAIDFHHTLPFEYEIDLFAQFMVVSLGFAPRRVG